MAIKNQSCPSTISVWLHNRAFHANSHTRKAILLHRTPPWQNPDIKRACCLIQNELNGLFGTETRTSLVNSISSPVTCGTSILLCTMPLFSAKQNTPSTPERGRERKKEERKRKEKEKECLPHPSIVPVGIGTVLSKVRQGRLRLLIIF